jgi:hypothetical protein
MFPKMRAISFVSVLKKAVLVLLVSYCVLTTFLLWKLKPEPLIIGIDQYGTRIIKGSDDKLIKLERYNFVKKFLTDFYNFNSTNYTEVISQSGELLSLDLWEEKREEFLKISEGLKKESLSQVTKIEELREVDPLTYQADLSVKVMNRLREVSTNIRVTIKIKQSSRRASNPFPYEVERYDEQSI